MVIAAGGVERLGRLEEAGALLDPAVMVPAPGQGVLALEVRGGDAETAAAVAGVSDARATTALAAERAVVRALDASCRTPVGAHATWSTEGELSLMAFAGLPDGSVWIRDQLTGRAEDAEALGTRVGERLLAAGAADILRQAEAAA
jgi:hydroxymethylbilane synthase